VSTLLVDAKTQTIYAGVVNDKTYGGVFASHDEGLTWTQQSDGLQGRDVFNLTQSPQGTILAGTNAGIFRLDGANWQPIGKVVKSETKTSYVVKKGKRTKTEKIVMVPAGQIDERIHDLNASGSTWYAATAKGIYSSSDQGATWEGGPVLGKPEYRSVVVSGPVVVASERTALAMSNDEGKTWQPLAMPQGLTWLQSAAVTDNGSLWLGGREGVFYSDDHGQTWSEMKSLPLRDISGLSYDANLKRIVITSWASSWVLAVNPADRTFKFYGPGWKVRHVQSVSGRLLAATAYNGVVLEPQKTSSKVTVAHNP
jgi:ligand-binding sensor domain-containing protein